MLTALIILLWVLAAVVALLLVALVTPLRIEARASIGGAFRYRLTLRPFGHFGPRLALADSERPKREKRSKIKAKKTKAGKKIRRDPRRILGAAFRLLSEIADRLRVDRVAVDLRFGADDPSETGQLFGSLAPIIYGTGTGQRFHLTVEPVFDRTVFDGRVALDVTMTPAHLIPPVIRFGWSVFGARRK